MILLETHNCILVDLIRQRFEASQYVPYLHPPKP